MIKKLKALYQQQLFFPSWVGIFVNPFYFARAGLGRAMYQFAPILKGQLLDVGCGTKPYRKMFNVDAYIGLDIETEDSRKRGDAEYLYDGTSFPFAGSSFDSLLCNQVLEHVFNPDEFLDEINRVLKPGGKLLLTVPFVWDEHEQPYDYARYSSFGLRALLEKHGFTILQHQKLGADATTLFQLVNAYLFKITQGWPKLLRYGFTVTVMALVNLLGLVAGKLLPGNPDLFLDHIVLAEKKS
jgi:SAM-dependent methyltransferase